MSVCSGPGVDDIVFQSSCTETAGGAAEGRWLDRLRPSPHGRQESGGDGGGRDEKRSSFRSPGPPTASTHQVRTRNRNVRNSHLFKKMFLLKSVCVCVCFCRDTWHRCEAVKLVFVWTLLQVSVTGDLTDVFVTRSQLVPVDVTWYCLVATGTS